MKYVFIKYACVCLQKYITWLKKSGKGRREWNKAFVKTRIQPIKLNILMKTKYTFDCQYYVNYLQFLNLIR
jgi:hypothetical protein